jgi:hypothetical protein
LRALDPLAPPYNQITARIMQLFAEITRQRIRRGTFNKWTANAKSILVKHRRAKKALVNSKAGCQRMSQNTPKKL